MACEALRVPGVRSAASQGSEVLPRLQGNG